MTIAKHIATLALALATLGAGAQDLDPAAPAQKNPVFLVGATVHTLRGRTIEDGVVAFNEGVITLVADRSVMSRISLAPGTEVIDVSGHHLYPGLIDAVTILGLREVSAVRATRDSNEVGAITPEVRAYVAVNPDSTVIPTARSAGVLTVGVFPTGGLVQGRASVLTTDGWTTEDLAIERDAGMVIDFDPKRTDELDTLVENATAYAQAHDQTDLRLEAMTTILPGPDQNPVFLRADSFDEITKGVNWALAHALDPVIVGGRDAHLCAQLLRSTDTPVIIGGTFGFPKRPDSAYDEPYTLPKKLQDAGVAWALTMSGRFAHERNLPDAAAIAVAHGLDHDAALHAITLGAAKILGVSDRIGSIERGKHATIVVTTDDILDVRAHPVLAFIRGRAISLDNKQTDLRDTYREKYRQLGIIDADESDD